MRRFPNIMANLALAVLFTSQAYAQVNVGQLIPETAPGATFSLAGENLTSKRWEATLSRAGTSQAVLPTALEPSKITFLIPMALAPGAYLVHVKENDAGPVFVGQVTVAAPPPKAETTPRINRTVPIAGWIKLWKRGSQFDFDILGERLAVASGMPLLLRLGDQRLDLNACPPSDSDKLAHERQKRPCYVPHDPQKVSIHGLPTVTYGGPHKVSITTGQGQSNDDVNIRISRITPRMIKWLSFVFLGLLLILLVWSARDAFETAAGSARQKLLGWLLLDQQTNTFSLSKLQLLLWMLAIAYSYIFLQLALVFAQGEMKMAPLPDNVGWLLGLTGGTTLTSMMLTRSRGSKGAGDAGPALSDLVSSGGVFAPDRVQLLLWTVIGCCAYVLIVLRSSTESFKDLPAIDPGLLGAMGVTAAVYAGGKYVRLPGPVVNQVTVDVAAGTINVRGQNLHSSALISLDRQPADVKIAATPTPNAASDALSSELKLELKPLPFEEGEHLLRVTNLDGQYAEAWFPADVPKIAEVTVANGAPDEVPAGKGDKMLNLAGAGFRVGSTAEWQATQQASPTVIGAEKIKITSGAAAEVTLTPGTTEGAATITLVSPHDIRAARRVTVKSGA